MSRVFQIILLNFVILAVFVLFGFGEEDVVKTQPHRTKRYLAFSNITHAFLRLNFKANMVPWNQIFAQALGFRMNWDDPPDSFHPYHHLYRRSLYSHMETLLDSNGISGRHCIRRAICELDIKSKTRRVYYKILQIIFRKQSNSTDRWHHVTEGGCEESIATCPFSLLKASLYTDI